MRPAARSLAALGLAAALAYLVAAAADSPLVRLAAKPIPALVLAAWVAANGTPLLRRPVALGLVLSALGDLLLEIGLFLPGLGAFLSAHLAYLVGFVAADRRPALARALPFLAWGALALWLLRPGLGAMAVPVAVYVGVICAMMWRAAARVGAANLAAWLGLAGALAFGASDTLIAVDRFHAPIEGVRWPIMVLYWVGQWGIAASATPATQPIPATSRSTS